MRCIVRFSVIYLTLVSFLSPIAISAADEWKLEKERKGIEIYTTKTSGTKYKDIKSTTIVDANIDIIIDIYRDFKSYPEWQNFMEEMAVSGSTQSNTFFAYASYNFPWPISNRDIVIKTEIDIQPGEKKVVVLNISGAAHPDFPEKKGTIRIKDYHCKAILEELTAQQTKVTYTIQADPGGNIPALFVNVAAKEAQFLTMNNLKKFVRKHQEMLAKEKAAPEMIAEETPCESWQNSSNNMGLVVSPQKETISKVQ